MNEPEPTQGIPDEARALTTVKDAGAATRGAGSAAMGAAVDAAGAVGSVFRRKRATPSAETGDSSVGRSGA